MCSVLDGVVYGVEDKIRFNLNAMYYIYLRTVSLMILINYWTEHPPSMSPSGS